MPVPMATNHCPWRLTSFPSLWRGKSNAVPVTCPVPALSSLFFPIALHHFGFLSLPRASSSCPSTCYTVHFQLAAHLTWLSCQAKAELHHTISCLGIVANFCWLHRLCFRPDVKLHCNPIKPMVPGWLFLSWKRNGGGITSADSEEKPYEAPQDFHANEFQSIINSSLLVFHLPVHKNQWFLFSDLLHSPSLAILEGPDNKRVEWKEKKKDFSPRLQDIRV